MSEDSSATDRILTEPDRDVWVVERQQGDGWYVSAVLTSHEDAEQYEEDLREFITTYPDDFPEEFKTENVRTRHGGRQSPTKFFEDYPRRCRND